MGLERLWPLSVKPSVKSQIIFLLHCYVNLLLFLLQKSQSHSLQPAQLNNSAQFQSSTQQLNVSGIGQAVGSPLFAFHQNLYPNLESGMNANVRQECGTPPMSVGAEGLGASTTGPRLYSTLPSCDVPVGVQPFKSSNQHNFNMQVDLNKVSTPPVNTVLVPQQLYTPVSIVDSQAYVTGSASGSNGSYSKFRQNDGGKKKRKLI